MISTYGHSIIIILEGKKRLEEEYVSYSTRLGCLAIDRGNVPKDSCHLFCGEECWTNFNNDVTLEPLATSTFSSTSVESFHSKSCLGSKK